MTDRLRSRDTATAAGAHVANPEPSEGSTSCRGSAEASDRSCFLEHGGGEAQK